MEYETINKETPEMKQLISGIREVNKRIREIAQTHRPLFGGEIYLTGREVCEHLFISPRTLQDYRDKGIIPYTQIAGKILYCLSDINPTIVRELSEIMFIIVSNRNKKILFPSGFSEQIVTFVNLEMTVHLGAR